MLLAARTQKQNKQNGGKKLSTRELVWKKGKSVTWARKSDATSKCEQMVGR